MKLGQSFDCLEDLEKAIKQFENETFSNLSIFKSRTIEGARAKGLKRNINPKLEYVELDYKCIKAGKFISKSKGVRPKRSSFREECPVYFKIRVNGDGTKLVIKALETKHNHVTSQAIYNHLPRQRQLDPEAKVMAAKPVSMKVSEKILQNDLMKSLKDIHNLNINLESNDFESLIEKYKNQGGTILDVVKNEEGVLQALFYQDKEMQRMFKLCPEMLFIDAIHKVNDRTMPLYVFLIEDPNGHSEIVAFCLLMSEHGGNVLNMAQLFKRHNKEWEKTQCIMANKDFNEQNIFHLEFPQSKLLICIFHAMRSFHREITTEKMNITRDHRNLCLQIIQKMVYARSEENYMQLYEELKNTKLSEVINYFNKNWHDIRKEWIFHMQEESLTFGYRLKSTNQKITQVVSRLSRFDQIFEGLDNLVAALRAERDHVAANVFSKTFVNTRGLNTTCQEFCKYLTPFAFEMVSQQMKLKEKVKILNEDPENQSLTVLCSSGNVNVTTTSCQCSFRTSIALPCRHILKARELFNLALYCPDLCACRWTRDYYREVCRIFPSSNQTDPINTEIPNENNKNVNIYVIPDPKIRVLSYSERFRISKIETDQMASIMAEATGKHFETRRKELLELKQKWKHEDQQIIADITGLEVTEPQIAEVEVTGPQIAEVEVTVPQIAQLEVTGPQVAELETTDPDANCIIEPNTNNINTNISNLDRPSITQNMTSLIGSRKRGRPKLSEKYSNNSSAPQNVNDSNENTTSKLLPAIEDLTLSPKVPKRDKSKAANLTVIGLPKKKVSRTLTPFSNL